MPYVLLRNMSGDIRPNLLGVKVVLDEIKHKREVASFLTRTPSSPHMCSHWTDSRGI